MARSPLPAWSIATVVVLTAMATPAHFVVAGVAGAPTPAVGDPVRQVEAPTPPSDRPETYAVGQAGQCIAVEPIGDGNQTGVAFYDMAGAPEYSSLGTTHLQQPATSQLFVYNGSEGHNLVFLHGKFEESETGGSISVSVSGLPANGSWIVEDDDYNGRDDNFVHGETTSEIDWMWQPDKTDGAVFRGLADDGWEEITIDPAFTEASYGATELDPPWPYASNEISAWIVRDGTTGTMQLVQNQSVSIRPGSCDTTSPEAALEAGAYSTTEPITLDASNSTSETAIVAYQWDFDGDGTVDRTTATPTTSYNHTSGGSNDPTVTVVDRFGNTDTANDAPLVAVADVPDTVQLGGIVQADGSNSSDGGTITSYEWDFNDDGMTDESLAVAEHQYSVSGTYTVTLVVTDDDGHTATDTATIEVVNETAPSALLSVPDTTASTNGTVFFDATASSDADGIEEFQWDFDGDGTIDNTTESGSTEHQYQATGTYQPTVIVVDSEGGMTRAAIEEPLQIVPDTPPTLELSVPASAAVGSMVSLEASASDEDGIVSYQWDFDGDDSIDDTESTGTVEVSFDAIGNATVSVTAVDTTGRQTTSQEQIQIIDETPPTAVIDGPSEVSVGEPVTLSGADSTDAGAITGYEWQIDNESATGETFTHTFSAEGSHTVQLTVTDAAGLEDTASTSLIVGADESTEPGGDGSEPGSGGGSSGAGGAPSGGGSSGGSSGGGSASGGGGSSGGSSGGGSASGGGGSSGGSSGGGGGAGGGGTSSGTVSPSSPSKDPQDDELVNVSTLSVSREQTTVGATLRIDATVVNRDSVNRSETLSLSVDGSTIETRTVEVPARTAVRIPFTHRFDTAGVSTIRLGDRQRTVSIAPRPVQATPSAAVTGVTVSDRRVPVGDSVTVIAEVTNTGGAEGTVDATFSMFGEVVDRRTVTVPRDATRTVRFDRKIDSPGTYNVSVNGHAETIHVVGETPTLRPLAEQGSDTNRSTPLWLLIGGIVALAVVGLLVNRQW